MNIAVYCSSRDGLPEEYQEAARELGRWIGHGGHTLVYGGVDAGLMHVVAQATHQAGGHITGVVPERFKARTDALVDRLIACRDLADRKDIMINLADVFVVLPGGIGTIDEWVSTLSQLMVNPDDHRPIVALNVHGMYDGLLKQLRDTARSPFARGHHIDMTREATSAQEMLEELKAISN